LVLYSIDCVYVCQYFLLFNTDDSPMIIAIANARMIATVVQSIFIFSLKVKG